MKTEEQAKQCWCPFARVLEETNASMIEGYFPVCNRTHNGKASARALCIASKCMLWVWGEQGHDAGDFPNTDEHPSTGHCGLAKP